METKALGLEERTELGKQKQKRRVTSKFAKHNKIDKNIRIQLALVLCSRQLIYEYKMSIQSQYLDQCQYPVLLLGPVTLLIILIVGVQGDVFFSMSRNVSLMFHRKKFLVIP